MGARMLHAAARNAKAAPICLLTREWANRRAERPDTFLDLATSQTWIDGGAEYRFPSVTGMWDRVGTFIREEGECCPFLAFEANDDGGEILLKVLWPEEVTK